MKTKNNTLITLTSDFGVQSQGIGMMEGVIFKINPKIKVIHLMHGLPDFNIVHAARTMETVQYLAAGYHICIVDPGVGSQRKPLAIKVKRGDVLIGPDNGVLIPATRILGGIIKAVEITNPQYMNQPVSPIFHGRDIFAPAAAWLSLDVPLEKLGPSLDQKNLIKAPYEEAMIQNSQIKAMVISTNKFGSCHLNILPPLWDKTGIDIGQLIKIKYKKQIIQLPYQVTFSDVGKGKPLIIKDDYGRMEIALNQGSFCKKYKIKTGDRIVIKW